MDLLRAALIALIAVCTVADDEVTVTLRQGIAKGTKLTFLGKTVEVYLGIPFAEPPIGDLRFQKPKPAQPWNGILDATHPKSSCIQPPLPMFTVAETSEDCLFLNVWTQGRKGPPKAVMVWIHGGAFNFGSSYQNWYNGTALVATEDVVVVSVNYRLGVFGFLAAHVEEAPGNMGLHDQALALQWVQDNIQAFGGDRERVTVFGESAGSMSVGAHIISPVSKGLFHRAIMMSGTLQMTGAGAEEMTRRANNFARHVGCATFSKDFSTEPREILKCLRSKTAEELLAEYEHWEPKTIRWFMPTYNDEFLPVAPCFAVSEGLHKAVDIMSGVTEGEGAFIYYIQPDKRLLEDDLNHISEEELEGAARSVVLNWVKDIESGMWKHYEKKIRPSSWKTDYRKACLDYVTDALFKCPLKLFSERHVSTGSAMFSFLFGHRSAVAPFPKWATVPHAADIFYFFGLPLVYPEQYTDEDREICRDVMKMAASFAKKGEPVLPTGEEWPKYTIENPTSIYIKKGNFTPVKALDMDICSEWRKQVC